MSEDKAHDIMDSKDSRTHANTVAMAAAAHAEEKKAENSDDHPRPTDIARSVSYTIFYTFKVVYS